MYNLMHEAFLALFRTNSWRELAILLVQFLSLLVCAFLDYYILSLAGSRSGDSPSSSLGEYQFSEMGVETYHILAVFSVRLVLFYLNQFFLGFSPSVFGWWIRKSILFFFESEGKRRDFQIRDIDFMTRQVNLLGGTIVHILKGVVDLVLFIFLISLLIKNINFTPSIIFLLFVIILGLLLHVLIVGLLAKKSNFRNQKYFSELNEGLLSENHLLQTAQIRLSAMRFAWANGVYFLIRSLPRFYSDLSIYILLLGSLIIVTELDSKISQNQLATLFIIIRMIPLAIQLNIASAKIIAAAGPFQIYLSYFIKEKYAA